MDGCLSQASMVRQINRAGKRWKLSAKVVDDVVKVCREQYGAEVRGGVGDVSKEDYPICTFTEDSQFNNVLNNRLNNGEIDVRARYQAAERIAKAQRQAVIDAYDADVRSRWKTRNRVLVGPGFSIPAGLANRGKK